jgi:hypothetical protein
MASATALQHEARTLILDALAWLRSSYPQHGFYVERDLVWTLQKWLDREITARALGLRVLNDYGARTSTRRSFRSSAGTASSRMWTVSVVGSRAD